VSNKEDAKVIDGEFTPVGEQGDDVKSTAMVPASYGTALTSIHPLEQGETALAYVSRLMELIPNPDEDVIDKIAAGILGAINLEDENELWDSTGSQKCIGKVFTFHSVHIQPSDFEDAPLPYFLVCKVSDHETGEETVMTTGAVNICTSLVKAHMLGNLPAVAEICGPRRRPKSGRVPLHLKWYVKLSADQGGVSGNGGR